MRHEEILKAIYDPANRANPYPLFAELRRVPVSWQEGGPSPEGTFVVSTYRELVALLHDPRLSSELLKGEKTASMVPPDRTSFSFMVLDPPEHHRLRQLAMRHFGPPDRSKYLDQLVPEIRRVTQALVDDLEGERRFDLVVRVAYSLPVRIICEILGVPRHDQPRFQVWAGTIARSAGRLTPEVLAEVLAAFAGLREYMAGLVELRRRTPSDDLLSRMANDDGPDGRMSDPDLLATVSMLLVAGHETTTNLIANGMLTLLRHPDALERLRREPNLVVGTVEEVLRYDPTVQLLPTRTTLSDVSVGDVTIPKGVLLTLALAAANRDPTCFRDPDRFDPDRKDNAHLGFGSGIHFCFGAPLARIEAQIALTELVQRLDGPRLVLDPPPYRESPMLRGPRELLVEVDGVRTAGERVTRAPARTSVVASSPT
jgi:cytochrome P450